MKSRSAFCHGEKKREGGIEAKGRPESWKGAELDGGQPGQKGGNYFRGGGV